MQFLCEFCIILYNFDTNILLQVKHAKQIALKLYNFQANIMRTYSHKKLFIGFSNDFLTNSNTHENRASHFSPGRGMPQ